MKAAERISAELVSADAPTALRLINEAGISLYDLSVHEDGLACRFSVDASAYSAVRRIAQRRGDSITVISRSGALSSLGRLRRRPLLCTGLAFLFLLTFILPTRVFFFQVRGNSQLSSRTILTAAEASGVCFGISRRELRSEKIKNALLERLPELRWAGLNTAGCMGIISVREGKPDKAAEQSGGVTSIVALRDGVISSMTVEKGSGVCIVGQAVKAGQVLISGYTDCGLTIRAGRAQGEVYADTQRTLTVISPTNGSQRESATEQSQKFSLILGKKRINFYKGSGISPSSCVKMYEETYLTLPGGFELPIGFVTETWESYDHTEDVTVAEENIALADFAKNYLSQQMVAGQILNAHLESGAEEGYIFLRGEYACREMIGKVRNEESLEHYDN